MTNPIPAVQHASVYRPSNGQSEHRCGYCANPITGGRDDCPKRPSQTVPYDEPEFPESEHEGGWPADGG